MAAALPPSTAPPVLTRHSAAGLLPFRRARRGQYAAPQHGGCCARQLPAAATAGATCGLTRRATAVAAAQGRAQAGEGAEEGSLAMVLLSTAVAVCGSFRVRHLCWVFCAGSSWGCQRHWTVQFTVWYLWICLDGWRNDRRSDQWPPCRHS